MSSKSATLLLTLLLCLGSAISSAVDLNCTSSGHGDLSRYSISSPVTLPGSCDFRWMAKNGEEHDILATNTNSSETVRNTSLIYLATSVCYTNLTWEAECYSETGLMDEVDYLANCTSTCENETHFKGDEGVRNAIIFVFLMMVIVSLVALCYLCTDKIYRIRSWRHNGCHYQAPEKTPDQMAV